jgi:4-amino-4-deoxy-L-arabinose transferase-like glycosyltransferase
VRGLSLLFGTLTVALTYLFARRVGGRGLGLGAGLLLAASALAVQSSVEARMYALLGCFTLAATWALWEAAARQRPKLWIVYAVVLTVAIYLDYFAFLLVPVHVAYVAWTSRADARALRGLLLALGGALVAYGPWWPSLADQFVRGHLATFWNGRMPLTAPLDTVALAAFGGRLLGLGDYLIGSGRVTAWQLLLVLPFLALVLLGTRCLSRREDGALLLACWAVPLIVLIGASLFTGIHYAVPRYGGFLQPFFAVLLASGVLRVARVRVGAGLPVVLLAAIVALNLSVLAAGARGSHPFDWAAAARHIDQRWQEGDGVLFYPHTARLVFGYYFRRSGAPVLTLYPPYQRGGGEAVDMRRTLPVVPTLLPGARRVWVVLTVPTPAGSTEALLSAMGRWYRLSEAQDFHYVWIYLFEKPR